MIDLTFRPDGRGYWALLYHIGAPESSTAAGFVKTMCANSTENILTQWGKTGKAVESSGGQLKFLRTQTVRRIILFEKIR
ncbi:hypothetical protein [Allofournierella massiliensis]|uniref:hypothetical protein n=1 Tax=Allofournierella massiliensis TaxID=1650663 RepID=UPI001047D258|nr:hypothetical protein [Fournierella massiliensis]